MTRPPLNPWHIVDHRFGLYLGWPAWTRDPAKARIYATAPDARVVLFALDLAGRAEAERVRDAAVKEGGR